MSYIFKGFPNDVWNYAELREPDYGLVSELNYSSLNENVAEMKDYKNTYPIGEGIEIVDLGLL